MKKIIFSYQLQIALACWLVCGLSTSFGQQDEAAKLPTADSVIKKYVDATGGLEKYKTIKTMQQDGKMSLPAAGINGEISIKTAGSGKIAVSVDFEGVGTESTGSNGEFAWSDSTMTGTRLLEGKEAEQIATESDFRRIYDPASIYKSLEVIGISEVEKEKCYEVKVTKKNDEVQMEYYSIESGLQKKTVSTTASPMGEIEIQAIVKEYKEVDGFKFPSKLVQKMPNGMEMEMEFSTIKVNPDFPEDTFDIPEKIKKLIEKQKEKKKKEEEKAKGGESTPNDKK